MHGVFLIDSEGAVIKRWMVQHTEDELMKVFGELINLGVRESESCLSPPRAEPWLHQAQLRRPCQRELLSLRAQP